MNKTQLNALLQHIQLTGGATLTPKGELTAFSSGFMVSLAGYETQTQVNKIDLKALNNYFNTALKLTRSKDSKGKAYVGFWLDNDVLYIDISIHVEQRITAIQLGTKNKQLAIYDCKACNSIYLA
jgi:hypothetical protein